MLSIKKKNLAFCRSIIHDYPLHGSLPVVTAILYEYKNALFNLLIVLVTVSLFPNWTCKLIIKCMPWLKRTYVFPNWTYNCEELLNALHNSQIDFRSVKSFPNWICNYVKITLFSSFEMSYPNINCFYW